MKKFIPLSIVLLCMTYWACQKEINNEDTVAGTYTIRLSFAHTVGTSTMQLGGNYQNQFGEDFTLTTFKYYISNIVLKDAAGATETIDGVYHLVDEADSSTKTLDLPVRGNSYSSISFLIGVDSTKNVSGTQSGDLDPARGMFWTWNSGYIMAKMEATSPLSTATANKVEYHIGGFTTGQNVTRRVTFDLSSSLRIKNNGTSEVMLKADALKWFAGSHDMKISTVPVCIMPGSLALQFADNYAQMFTLAGVNNN